MTFLRKTNKQLARLRGGALVYALFVGLVVLLLMSSLFLLYYYRVVNAHNSSRQVQLHANVYSAFEWIKSRPGALSSETPFEKQLFADETVTVSHQEWGLYRVVDVSSQWKRFKASSRALMGLDLSCGLQTALFLKENKNHLSVVGNCRIVGDVYLPKLGVRKGYIEGRTFSGSQMIFGNIETSTDKMPELLPGLHSYEGFRNNQVKDAEVRQASELYRKKNVSNAFSQKTLCFYDQSAIRLNGEEISGKVVIESAQQIIVGQQAKLQGVILIAPKIVIDNRQSSLQAFALDSLVLKQGSELQYPSSLCLFAKKNILKPKEKKVLQLEQASKIAGNVIADMSGSDGGVWLRTDKGSSITGLAYCSGQTTFEGKIAGSLYVNQFIIRTPSSIFLYHLRDAEIDFTALSENFSAGIIFQRQKNKLNLARWLN